MDLLSLLNYLPFYESKGEVNLTIQRVCNHSKLAKKGDLFIHKPKDKKAGQMIVDEILSKGVDVILTPYAYDGVGSLTQIIVPDVQAAEDLIALHFYQKPQNKLGCIGVTGTNGKTTCTYLMKNMLEKLGFPSGLIGTVEYIVGDGTSTSSSHTTPDSLVIQDLLFQMCENNLKYVVMEVSSHALVQRRVKDLLFDVAVFTNLTQDHLDYHSNMQEYAQAKALLFKQSKKSVINKDSDVCDLMISYSREIFTYSIYKASDLQACDISLSDQGSSFNLLYQGHKTSIKSPLVGLFNIYNLLAVIGVGLSLGFSLDHLQEICPDLKGAKGRLELVDNSKGLKIFVDYAHTEDALSNVLDTLNRLKKGRLILVFGCGGDRDRGKRSKMGAVAEQKADMIFLTSDNPRSEDPASIIKDILSGIKSVEKVMIEPNRYEAIKNAIEMAKQSDLILIAGKGHETYQVIGNEYVPFDDKSVIKDICFHDS
ncbi:MAG: UDP-N-acetylmuramoyl-L-alanyl-D-glutamate--2,6-diaminopimelate ligase [Rhabdochlamydiaceae bacterium]